MNNKIKSLNKKLATMQNNCEIIEAKLQLQWDGVFAKNKTIKKALIDLENSNEYTNNEYGDVLSWIRFDFKPFKDCQKYLIEYLRETHNVDVDLKNDTLMLNHSNDNLMIQDDTRRDNGVWQSHNLVIPENEYKNEDGEIDLEKRNALIEKYMHDTGYYPGVFRVTRYGDIFSVNTK